MAAGTVVLHVSPDSDVGGTLVLSKDGDMIEIDVDSRRLHLDIIDDELQERKQAWKAPDSMATRGYVKLYIDHSSEGILRGRYGYFTRWLGK